MFRYGVAAVLAAAALGLPPEPAGALPGSQLMSNGTYCRTWFGKPHEHWGDSSGKKSRGEAYTQAVRNWAGFVALEYGRKYADFALALDKEITCKDDHGSWGCIIKARACRR